ncbi:MAG: tRNA lysidine(34) synthetase TilS [Candidatus Krumholzibacteriia bacterium]
MSCIEKVRDYIRTRGMIAPGTRVLVAVSGGSDSMALMTILAELSAEIRIELAAAHFDHGIRPEAGRERALVQRAADKLGIPLFLGSGSVPAEARRIKKGIEETARLLRYRFLEETARAWNAGSVALGHNRDDQVETILHHIIRGTGWRGLQGIPPRRGLFVRPLLACSRVELRAHVRSRRVPYALDRSNLDNRFLRNRIRNRLIPYLERGYNPAATEALLRLGENLAEGWETLEKPLFKLIPRAGSREEVALRLVKIEKLTDFHLYLLIDLVLRERFGVLQDVERTHFDAAKRLIRSGRSGKAVHFPHGIVARLEHENLMVSRSGGRTSAAGEVIIAGPGTYPLPWWNLSAEVESVNTGRVNPKGNAAEAFFAGIVFPVRVRGKRPGDRFVPFGMKGRKKLSDLFIDRKVPLSRRGAIPVFEDARGVFWVPGVAAAERTRIVPGTREALRIKLFKGSGKK